MELTFLAVVLSQLAFFFTQVGLSGLQLYSTPPLSLRRYLTVKALSIKTEINQIFSSFFSRGQFPIWHHCISGTFHLQYTANFKLKSVAVSVTLLVRGKVWLVSLVQRVKIF